ncbi:probable Ufm1-specific protease 1 isoform X2 [Musca domestica]|uniref:Probable Ufm1-specific protease 1 isoform X2 n=1 Tax=Musca domestica TaxID=7370 RepID=A0ABM3V7J6_MUSDO|nr:probable Ufm1-specific protease 1 isoform X2 [Musca domestica]
MMAQCDVKDEAKAITHKTYEYELMHNIVGIVQPPSVPQFASQADFETHLTREDFLYYHYGCDGFRDHGWGCAYRTLQSMISWILPKRHWQSLLNVPSLREIQQTLVRIEDKPSRFVGSRDWIGALEVFYTVDTLYDVPCKILHVTRSEDLAQHIPELVKYFRDFGGFVMMGGDMDAASKGIAGVHTNGKDSYLLIVSIRVIIK